MDNLMKIKKFSKKFHLLLSSLLVIIPVYYVSYWAFINHWPETLINVNMDPTPLIPNVLPVQLQMSGFFACLLPLSALMYIIVNIRKLFSYYKEGVIFSFEHVAVFKKTARALLVWVVLSIVYESIKSVLFSAGNPPGSRVIAVGVNPAQMTALFMGAMVFIISWVMDEGRLMYEENQLTV